MRRRRTEAFSDLSGEFIRRLDPRGKMEQARAVQAWPRVAGDEISRHTRGLAMKEGELIIFVDSPAWATELSLMAEDLKKGLNTQLGRESVRSIRFNVSNRVTEAAKEEAIHVAEVDFYKPDKTEPVPLTKAELRQAEYIAAAVADDELREKALRVMIKDLEMKKGARPAKGPQTASGGSEDGDSES